MNIAPEPNARGKAAVPAGKVYGGIQVVLLLIITPLFFHVSDAQDVGPYSARYARFLAIAVGASALVSFLLARRCRSRQSLAPAYGFIVSVLALALCLMAAEIYLRVTNSGMKGVLVRSLFTGFELPPHLKTYDFQSVNHQTDAFGFRRCPPDWSARTNAYRIFIIGGSSAFGLGVECEQTFGRMAQDALREQWGREDIDVIMAGNPGHNSLQTMIRFLLDVLPRNPDMVIYYESKNDAVHPVVHSPKRLEVDPRRVLNPRLGDYVNDLYAGKNRYVRSGVYWFAKGRLRVMGERMRASTGDRSGSPARAPESGKDGTDGTDVADINGRRFYLHHISVIADVCARHDIRFVPMTFIHCVGGDMAWVGRAIDRYNELLVEAARANGWPLVDVRDDYRAVENQPALFVDDHHPNDAGSAFLAERLVSVIAPLVAADLERASGVHEKGDVP